MTDLLSLAEKVEAAESPSRELDREISDAIGIDHSDVHPARHYTASIDAASSLIPEDWCWQVGFCGAGYWAHVWEPVLDFDVQVGAPGIATPAIALVVAALRARAALAGGEG